MSQKQNNRIKVITLWGVFLLGLLFHTELALMPLFHGLSVKEDASEAQSIESISWILWLMLAFFVVPMSMMVGTAFTESYSFKKLHYGTTIVYSVLNFIHLVADLQVKPIYWYQIVLMAILWLVGLLLNLVSWQWLRQSRHPRTLRSADTI
jgi:hypothetical protein